MLPIKNTSMLQNTGDPLVRGPLLRMANHALAALNSERLIPSLVRLEGDILHVGDTVWNLADYRRVLVVGAGKAGNHMARALESILGARISRGLVIVKQLEPGDELAHIELALGGHPYPNESGRRATQRILDLLGGCASGDLVVSLISGGSSALMNCPAEGISVEEESRLTELLLTAGASILEINTVRRHVSAVNGGRLAQRVSASGAQMLNLILSDRVGDTAVGTPRGPTAYTGTQIGLDPTTFLDAWNILERYRLLAAAPNSVLEHLRRGPQLTETPKSPLPGVSNFVIQGLPDACAAAVDAARAEHLPVHVLTSGLEGDSRQAGMFLAAVAREVRDRGEPFAPPCVLVAAGETTVRLNGPAGSGGPSQELALSFAREVTGLAGVGIAAIETEGTDGPTTLAGAVTDGTTLERCRAARVDILAALDGHDCCPALTAVGDQLETGNTGTNLCDLNIIYIA